MVKIKEETLENIEKLIDLGYIRRRKHPYHNLWLLSHTKKCRIGNNWTNETLTCNGLIVDAENFIVERPFSKVREFNRIQIPNTQFTTSVKHDGIMGILYFIGNEPYIATKSGFSNKIAMKATEIFRRKYRHVFEVMWLETSTYTYVFEIICKETKFIVDYKGEEDLVLLARINKDTGEDGDLGVVEKIGLRIAKPVEFNNIDQMLATAASNQEGYVMLFNNGLRVNVKFPEYRRLYPLLTGISLWDIWTCLSGKIPYSKSLIDVPRDFLTWIQKSESNFANRYRDTDEYCKRRSKLIRNMIFRDDAQIRVVIQREPKYENIITLYLEERFGAYERAIWQAIKPAKKVTYIKERH